MTAFQISDRAKAILSQVATEAARRDASLVEPEDVLRGILREGNGVACHALNQLGIQPATIALPDPPRRTEPEGPLLDASPGLGVLPPDLLATAETEAIALGHRYIGTEHLLLALAGPRYPKAAAVLAAHGVTLHAARLKTAELLGRQLP